MFLRKAFDKLIIKGLLIYILGHVYFMVTEGIPYQDPTPEMLQKYNFHFTVGNRISDLGLIIMALGILTFLVRKVKVKFNG